ncbi:MAG TPA: outer membrane beta-barrel protein [Cyclobacteriaceae bacterium]|nr:outer membrane beta-barrel protein [Cyclobacteriaceae bacterium]
MHKIRLLSVCVCLCSLFAHSTCAQEFGVRTGATFSFFTNDFIMKGGNPGLLVGGIVSLPLSDAIHITGGLDYSQLSGQIDGSPQVTSGGAILTRESNITIHMLEASALGAYQLPLSFLGEASPFITGGLSIGYNLGTWDYFHVQHSLNQEITTYTGNENIKSYASNWLPAWNIGLRFVTPLEEGLFSKMLIDIRMRSSFDPPINTYPLTGSPELPGIRSISFSLGFMF